MQYEAELVYVKMWPEPERLGLASTPRWLAETAARQGEATADQFDLILGDNEQGCDAAGLFDVAGTYWVVLRVRASREVVGVEIRLQATAPKGARITASETLRRLPLKAMERELKGAQTALLQAEESAAGGTDVQRALQGDRQRRLDQLGALPKRGRRGSRGYDDAWYESVAEVVKDAEIHLQPLGTAVEKHFHVSKSTASRWIATCRARGLINRTPYAEHTAVVNDLFDKQAKGRARP